MPANGQCTVTPGVTFSSTTPLTASNLNRAAAPSVSVDDGAIGADQLDRDGLIEVLGTGAAGYNYLDNPNFASNRWSRGATSVSCPVGVKTYRADQWWCNPAGAAVTYARLASAPNATSIHAAEITGDTGVTTVDFGQDIPARYSSPLKTGLVFSFYFYNNTGAARAPMLRINTANAFDDFSAVTNRYAQTLDSVANGSWARLEIAIAAGSFTNMENGCQVVIRFPNGALDGGSDSVRIAQVKLEIASGLPATAFVVTREEEETSAAADTTIRNLFVNGMFDSQRFLDPGTTGPTCSAALYTVNAEAWWVKPNGAATLTYTRDSTVPGTGQGASGLARTSVKLTGGSGVNAVGFGQTLDPSQAGLLQQDVAISIWVRYHDGAAGSVTPALKIDTNDSFGTSAAVTNLVNATLSECADDVWTRLEYQVDGSAITNLSNGGRIYLEFPSGSLDDSAKYVHIAEAQVHAGVTVAIAQAQLEASEIGYIEDAQNLVIARTSGGVLTINAARIILRHLETGQPVVMPFTNVTADITGSGAGGLDTGSPAGTTWYYVWAISAGTTAAALLSTSSTAPTMPDGYIARALIGVAWSLSISAFRLMHQRGKTVYHSNEGNGTNQRGGVALVDTVTTTTGWEDIDTLGSVDLNVAVPPNAASMFGQFGVTSNNPARISIASDSSGNFSCTMNADATAGAFDGWRCVSEFDLPLTTAQKAYIKSSSTTPTVRVMVRGYVLK